jgi:hypothetical protein
MLGRPSILPKQMLCSPLLQGFYPLRTPALLELLFGRFVGLGAERHGSTGY